MIEHTVSVDAALSPDPLEVETDDTVVWVNASGQAQSIGSVDGGQAFTTGPIQPGEQSLPITFASVAPEILYTCTSGLRGTVVVRAPGGATSFTASIRPYFTAVDRAAMNDPAHTFGIAVFDLWSRNDCEANWAAILDAISTGRMPPEGPGSDGPWSANKIGRFVADFTSWRDAGFRP
jgi:hypothetical protein